jgi:hypothetical protein
LKEAREEAFKPPRLRTDELELNRKGINLEREVLFTPRRATDN